MQIITTKKELLAVVKACKQERKTIGLVPTMGALHEGHASLVRRSVKENDITVVSVFLNPTQFNDKNDLKNYPRTLEADCRLLDACGADYVLAPSVEEMYPTPDQRQPWPLQRCLPGGEPPVLHRQAPARLLRRKGLAADCRHQGYGAPPRHHRADCGVRHRARR